MPETRPSTHIADALDSLVARGTITPDQREAILAEVSGPSQADLAPATGVRAGPSVRAHRSLSEVLIEVGLYVGSALVVAAAVVLAAQNWEAMSLGTQIASMAGTALACGAVGLYLAHGARWGTARRRLAGVLLTGAAASSAGTVALVMADSEYKGMMALAVAVAVMVLAQVAAASTVTELGLFVASFAWLQIIIEDLRPEGELVPVDAYEYTYVPSDWELWTPVAVIAFGLFWALAVSRWVTQRTLAVAVGMLAAMSGALPLIGQEETRTAGLVVMAAIAAVSFWRFFAESLWPWLVAAIASLTAFVFWLAGGAERPALAILVAGLALLASSALGMQVVRRRRAVVGRAETPVRAGAPPAA